MNTWITFPHALRDRRPRRASLDWDHDPSRAPQWQALLSQAHGDHAHRPHCDCWANGAPLQLVVRSREARENGNRVLRYHLARMPESGTLHRANCPFHEPDIRRDGRSGYEQGVITPLSDGNLRIALEGGLLIRGVAGEAEDRAQRQVPHGARPGDRQRQMSLLGLLHLLWEQSGLTNWRPEERRRRWSWGTIRQAIERSAATIVSGGATLDRSLAMIGYNDEPGLPAFEQIRACAQSERRVLLCGIVDAIDIEAGRAADPAKPQQRAYGPRIRLRFDGARAFNLHLMGPPQMAEALETQFPWAWRILQQARAERGNAQVIGLVTTQLRPTPDGRATTGWIERVALMEVGPSYVPVASSHELALLTYLQQQSRIFRKPLRFDRTTQLVHPDFELLDTRDPRGTPMEVYGRDTEEYRAHRDVKEAHYRDVYGVGNWWSWNAALREAMPDLPLPQD